MIWSIKVGEVWKLFSRLIRWGREQPGERQKVDKPRGVGDNRQKGKRVTKREQVKE